jgi:hypothetical protein
LIFRRTVLKTLGADKLITEWFHNNCIEMTINQDEIATGSVTIRALDAEDYAMRNSYFIRDKFYVCWMLYEEIDAWF